MRADRFDIADGHCAVARFLLGWRRCFGRGRHDDSKSREGICRLACELCCAYLRRLTDRITQRRENVLVKQLTYFRVSGPWLFQVNVARVSYLIVNADKRGV